MQISRELNPYAPTTAQYLMGRRRAAAGHRSGLVRRVAVGRSIRPGKVATTTDTFDIVDTQGNVYHPIPINTRVNPYAWTSQTLAPMGSSPPRPRRPATVPPGGGLVLFRLNDTVYSNRPLTLQIFAARSDEAVDGLARSLTEDDEWRGTDPPARGPSTPPDLRLRPAGHRDRSVRRGRDPDRGRRLHALLRASTATIIAVGSCSGCWPASRRAMGRTPWRPGLQRTAALALLLAALSAALAEPAWAGWSRPPSSRRPSRSTSWGRSWRSRPAEPPGWPSPCRMRTTRRRPPFRGLADRVRQAFEPRQIPGAGEVLGLAWFGRSLQLLVGDSPVGQTCCSTAGVVGLSASGRFGAPKRLASGLAGATAGQLVGLGHRMLAAVATERGVWIGQTGSSGRWSTHRLAGAGAEPQGLDATALPHGRTAVAWVGGSANAVGSRSIYVANGELDERAPALARSDHRPSKRWHRRDGDRRGTGRRHGGLDRELV